MKEADRVSERNIKKRIKRDFLLHSPPLKKTSA